VAISVASGFAGEENEAAFLVFAVAVDLSVFFAFSFGENSCFTLRAMASVSLASELDH
jgi:hypothetical protein